MDKQKRVLVLSNMYPGVKSSTFGIFVKNQVQALRDHGAKVDVVAVSDPDMNKPNVLKKYLKWATETFFTLLFKGRRYDVVHAHYVFPTGMLALLFKKWFKTRMVVTAHGGDINRMAKKSPRIKQWTTKILQEADHVITVGQDLHREIHDEYQIPKEKLSVINMGVNLTVFQEHEVCEARQVLGIKDTEMPIVFVGNIIREKGIMELLEAYKILKAENDNLSLYLVGNAKLASFKMEVEQYVKDHQLQDVHLHPAVPQSEVAIWMSAADVFVLPSHMEGFGLVAVEAMACGTPVVGTKVGGLQTLLADDHGVLVEDQNAASLAGGISSVLENPDYKEQLIEAGKKRAAENDQERMIERVFEIYENKVMEDEKK
ncbi:glycosyltransferase [Alkalihalobacillus sp. MEB130]|uniref:glycosyltransferase n=1 Tax=Alkalihalobacillus sp. MEB130 TaxID=2976704 RepID=UPI0028DE7BCB|nr:glycosyltransferase [Alkalihalobacillus sp. MEB130]MDT8858815.1 glycosyltransferase [Alkalihalobacillus sp. MEB130]